MRKLSKIVYASSVMREEDFASLFRDAANIPGQQAQRFNRLIIKGFEKNGSRVYAISSPPITKRNCSSRVVRLGKKKNGNTVFRYLPVFNVRFLKNALILCFSFLHTFFHVGGKKSAVVCDVLNISVAMGAVAAGRLRRKPCVGIVTDIPELMVTGHTEKMVKYCHKIIGKCTHYVFLTEAMNERLNPQNKPYTIVEGVCDEDAPCDAPDAASSKERACLYAGLLDAEYGVKSMVDAFLLAKIPDCRLHICGAGPYTDELKALAEKNENVVYHGVMMNQDVVALEKKVCLLINPRPSTGEFTKYSFPSKNMEYMTSGTPVLANKLPGIPDEYYDHIFTFSGETTEEMAESIKSVFSLHDTALIEKGYSAYWFVKEQKSSRAQAEKILLLIS